MLPLHKACERLLLEISLRLASVLESLLILQEVQILYCTGSALLRQAI